MYARHFVPIAGDYLLDKYDGATEVKMNRRGRLSIKDPRYSLPTANDLVYLDDSPNYCFANTTLGSLGLYCLLLFFFSSSRFGKYLRKTYIASKSYS